MRLRAGLFTLLSVGVLARPAWAVHETSPSEEVSTWLHWVVTAVMIAGLAAIMVKNAKRSHQD